MSARHAQSRSHPRALCQPVEKQPPPLLAREVQPCVPVSHLRLQLLISVISFYTTKDNNVVMSSGGVGGWAVEVHQAGEGVAR